MIEALSGGWADSKILQTHGKRMIDKDFTPKGKTTTQLKGTTTCKATSKAKMKAMESHGKQPKIIGKVKVNDKSKM